MNHTERTIIVAGGELDRQSLLEIYQEDDLLLAADAGVLSLLEIGLIPDIAIGDFDTTGKESFSKWQELGIHIQVLSPEKNETDTHAALEYAIRQGAKEVALFGTLGGARFDHAIANVQLLEWCLEKGVKVVIYHPHNRLRLIQGPENVEIAKTSYQYLSLLPISKDVRGIHTRGLSYPLHNGHLMRGYTLGISNEWAEPIATISIQEGICLICESDDGKNVSLF
ncbi:thiamine diphosphokinase [Risungbinella massiliensis]|uniref:thiamine diphosphokinase n=1 Tax=Risungbinella massiliensis TaxID=1329796 RepID=UPI0005CC492E|nr:thiamine diphosphokinase [Risungbinella massiliensis]